MGRSPLTTLLLSPDVKVQDAALRGLAALTGDSHDVAAHLAKAFAGKLNHDVPFP
jgi:hypothetical protein